MLHTLLFCCICFYAAVQGMPEPEKYILDFPTQDNPFGIKVNTTHPEKNYILLLGDWGAAPGGGGADVKIQTAVANLMKSFYAKQKAAGFNLLFVGLLGDNFYMSGQNCSYWTDRWIDIYGDIAKDEKWLSLKGNHDWGIEDDKAICPWNAPMFIDNKTGIPYAANQIEKAKDGCNPSNYYLPDYGYYYTINELNFEWIALDESAICVNGGCPLGKQDFKYCNNSQKVGFSFLDKIKDASEDMMKQRANQSENSNFIIAQHYPSPATSLLSKFISERDSDKVKEDIIWSAYGHIHEQKCDKEGSNGICEVILSGGGGGCCSEATLRGFYVIGFDSNKKMTQPYKFDDKEISCQYPCDSQITEDEKIKADFYHCCYTNHGQDCDKYDLSLCEM